jgi:hypothetical protein
MARHQAADGAASHPLVEAALRRRPHAHGGTHHRREELPGHEGPIGWPGPAHEGERTAPIGWPGELPSGPVSEHSEPGDQPDDEPEHPAAGQPRGLRRLLGRRTSAA